MQMGELGLDWQEGESCVGVKAKRGLHVRGGLAGAEREVSAIQKRVKQNNVCGPQASRGAGAAGHSRGEGWCDVEGAAGSQMACAERGNCSGVMPGAGVAADTGTSDEHSRTEGS